MFSTCTLDYLKSEPFWIILIPSLGFLTLFKNFASFLKWLYGILLRPEKDLKRYGSWALITGATDGIGKAFAFKLAEKGLNLVLISRDSTRLEMISDEIQEKHPTTEIQVFQIDFSGNDAVSSRVAKMKEFINGLEIGVLINNVGVTYPRAMYFHEVDEKTWMDVVRVNVEGTSYVTKAVVPGMVARRTGAVVNIGSGASVVVPSHPLYAIYAATKAYVDQLSNSLSVEYSQYGIDIQCQVPLYVSTKMATQVAFVEKPSVFVPTAEKYVAVAAGCIGRRGRCMPYWAHGVQWFFASLLPDGLLDQWRLSIGIRRMKLVH